MKDLQFQNASILPDTRTDILSTPFSILPEEVVMKLSPQGGSLQGFLGACSQVGGWEKEKSEPMREVAPELLHPESEHLVSLQASCLGCCRRSQKKITGACSHLGDAADPSDLDSLLNITVRQGISDNGVKPPTVQSETEG